MPYEEGIVVRDTQPEYDACDTQPEYDACDTQPEYDACDTQHGYDERDMKFKAVGLTIGILVLGVLATVLLMHWLIGYRDEQHHLIESPLFHLPSPAYDTTARFPEPRLQAEPRRELRQFREQEDHWLGTYGWTDKSAGLIRVPIEQAMELLLQRGLPVREAPDAH